MSSDLTTVLANGDAGSVKGDQTDRWHELVGVLRNSGVQNAAKVATQMCEDTANLNLFDVAHCPDILLSKFVGLKVGTVKLLAAEKIKAVAKSNQKTVRIRAPTPDQKPSPSQANASANGNANLPYASYFPYEQLQQQSAPHSQPQPAQLVQSVPQASSHPLPHPHPHPAPSAPAHHPPAQFAGNPQPPVTTDTAADSKAHRTPRASAPTGPGDATPRPGSRSFQQLSVVHYTPTPTPVSLQPSKLAGEPFPGERPFRSPELARPNGATATSSAPPSSPVSAYGSQPRRSTVSPTNTTRPATSRAASQRTMPATVTADSLYNPPYGAYSQLQYANYGWR